MNQNAGRNLLYCYTSLYASKCKTIGRSSREARYDTCLPFKRRRHSLWQSSKEKEESRLKQLCMASLDLIG